MSTDADELLKAEQAVQELLKELQNLKGEIGGYETARKSLTETQAALADLVTRISALTERTQAVAESLRTIGTPEILSRISRVRSLNIVGLVLLGSIFIGMLVIMFKVLTK